MKGCGVMRRRLFLFLAVVGMLAAVIVGSPVSPVEAQTEERAVIRSPFDVTGQYGMWGGLPSAHWAPRDWSVDLYAYNEEVYPDVVGLTGDVVLKYDAMGANCTSTGANGGSWVRVDVYVDGIYVGDVQYGHLDTAGVTFPSPGTVIGSDFMLGKTKSWGDLAGCYEVTTQAGVHTHFTATKSCYANVVSGNIAADAVIGGLSSSRVASYASRTMCTAGDLAGGDSGEMVKGSGGALGDSNDLFAIKRRGASGKTEVHVIDNLNPSKFKANTATGLHSTDNDLWEFASADYNGDGVSDLFAINRRGSSGKTEVHVINGADPGTFLLNSQTALHPTDNARWEFAVAKYNGDSKPDIWAINRRGGSGKTEVHILSGANPNQWLLNTATALHRTDNARWEFAVAKYNGDSKPDIWAINRRGGSGKTEVHILSGANPNQWLLNTATALHRTDNELWDFVVADHSGDGKPDVYAVSRLGSSGVTELHILDGTNLLRFHQNHATGLHRTDNTLWDFASG